MKVKFIGSLLIILASGLPSASSFSKESSPENVPLMKPIIKMFSAVVILVGAAALMAYASTLA
jgi:hypothetical protein